jgi:3-dehydrosphinganine reductase
VTIVARNLLKLQEAVKELSKVTSQPQQQVRMIAVDVGSSEKEVSDAFKPIIEEVGPVEVLINCAGTSIAGEFDSIDAAEFSRMIKINVLGSIFPTRAVVAGMKARRSGRIVFVSSQVTVTPPSLSPSLPPSLNCCG